MAKIIKQTKISDATLIRKTINGYGTIFAIDYGADGFSIIDVETPPLPQTLAEFLKGDDRTTFAISSDIDSLGHNILGTYPQIVDLYLFYKDGYIELQNDTFGVLPNLANVYVPANKVNGLKELYPDYAYLFKGLESDYVWTIPHIEGQDTLTEDLMSGFISMLSSAQIQTITKIIVPEDYEDYAWNSTNSLFNGTFTNLEKVEYENEMMLLENTFDTTQVGSILEVE